MTKTFNYSKETLIRYATDLANFLVEDLPDFESFDPDLNEGKRQEMIALKDWALSEGGDEINASLLADTTEQVNEELENSRKLYSQGRYWVMKAFPGRKAVQRQFGIGRFSKITDSQGAMVAFMKSLAESVADYRTQLEEAGTPVALLDSFATQAKDLEDANNAQEKKKGSRTIDTEERIRKLNALHQHTKDFNAAAEFVYYDSPAKRELYRPPSNRNAVEEEVNEMEG